jgi:lysophospholipase L1-like esterase
VASGATRAAHGQIPALSLPRCPNVCVSVGDATVVEGDARTRTLTFPVTLSEASATTVGVQYTLASVTASGGGNSTFDFNFKGGTAKSLSFVPAAATGLTPVSKTVSVTVYTDTSDETDETMRITLTSPSGGLVMQRAVGIGTILDDDPSSGLEVAVGDQALVEGHVRTGRTFQLPVTLSEVPAGPVTVAYTVTSTTATWAKNATVVGGDYGGKQSGTLSFAAGATGLTKKIAIPVWPDTVGEAHDEIVATITPVSLPGGAAITRASGTAVLVDDDPAPATEPVPDSMATLGDSISVGFDSCPPTFGECRAVVWSTGSSTDINSHYNRILQINPAIAGNAFNNAVSGARMNALLGQANAAVGQGVEYVTILMGANDACTSTEGSMTSVATYRSQFTSAMNALTAGLPGVRIFVASVPDVWRLWDVGHDDAGALWAWSTFGICQSLLANPQSTAQTDIDRRARVRQRVVDFNVELADVCDDYANCRFDGNLVHDYPFTIADLSPLDYFHPVASTQSTIALGTYAAGYNW